jgi:glutamate-5-semialdehyde dehydrogenase
MRAVKIPKSLITLGELARVAARELATTPTIVKDRTLDAIAEALEHENEMLLAANNKDMEAGRKNGLSEAVLDRLLLNPDRLNSMAKDVHAVKDQGDPVGEEFDTKTMANGLIVGRRRVPLGVIGAIYESRPNVTVDIAVLCIKSGNACILRGGSEAAHSNIALVKLIQRAVQREGLPGNAVQFIENTDRSMVSALLQMRDYLDLLIPRGGAELVRYVSENATMPAVTGGVGVCHTYIDRGADRVKAIRITHNAKVQRPSVCNALDTVLIHVDEAPRVLPDLSKELAESGVELRCDYRALSLLALGESSRVKAATEEDWGREFLDLILAVKVVDSLDEALNHIARYGSGHSEAIITENQANANHFLDQVDAAAVLVNASTRFTDGGQFGLGAEVAISTNKLHARGPMGLRELTSYKWIVKGTGQVRE